MPPLLGKIGRPQRMSTARVSNRVCVAGAAIRAATGAIVSDRASLHAWAASNSSVTIVPVSAGYAITLPNGKSLIVPSSPVSPPACKFARGQEQIAARGGQIPARYVEAYALVNDYRVVHPWPLGPADMHAASSDAKIEVYDPAYILVLIADGVRRVNGRGNYLLGCAGVEYYRVNLSTQQVLPFDGCIEMHRRGALPSFSQLPN